MGDINADGSPEIYVFTAETTGLQRAGLIAYSANKKKSLSNIYLAPVEEDAKNAQGYRGHDEMAVVEGIIAQLSRFTRRMPPGPNRPARRANFNTSSRPVKRAGC